MDKIKKYKKQIFTFITIFLLLEFGVYPCLTMANTFANIIGAVALLLLVLWGGLSLYDYIKNSDGLVDKKELAEAEQQWKEHVQKQMEKMNEINSQSVEPKPKRKYTKKTK
jgi:hypothetical protein